MKKHLIVSGLGILLHGIFIARNSENLSVTYIQVKNSKATRETLEREKNLISKILNNVPLVSESRFITIKIGESFSKEGNKLYNYDYGSQMLEFDKKDIIDFLRNSISINVKIVCIAEGGSVLVAARQKNSLIGCVDMNLKRILGKFFFETNIFRYVYIDKIVLPFSHKKRLLEEFISKKYRLGSVDNFESFDFKEYSLWARKILSNAGIYLWDDEISSRTLVHFTNKRIDIASYSEWLNKINFDEKQLIIKNHPSDTRDFSKIFPEALVISSLEDRLIPSELFKLETHKYIGWFTTGLLVFPSKNITLIPVPDKTYFEYSKKRFERLSNVIQISFN